MALPKKKRGFRIITLDGQNYNWCFSGKIDIRPFNQKNNKLIVDFGWFDGWLYMNDPHNRPPDFEPKRVTPEFVHQSILFALENGWDREKKTGFFYIKYTNSQFEIE